MHHTEKVTDKMWSLLPHLLKIVIGRQDDNKEGFAFNYFDIMEDYFKCIFKYDHDKFLIKKIGEESALHVILTSCIKIFQISKEDDDNTNGYVSIVILGALMVEFKGRLGDYFS
mmetsp:Transcript_1571/g.1379  ORF Transcript_1571/g.1379 Transcript_1571/m.1379 type:complete len:114 (-) Transcript_1571:549-890(-)